MNAERAPLGAQRGAATLAITMMLLFIMALATLSANRVLVVHQRSSANEDRSARAFEAAEAGLSWATSMLNDPRPINNHCLPHKGTQSFRDRYLPRPSANGMLPATSSHLGCRLNNGALVCSCPLAPSPPNLGDSPQPIFTLSFSTVADSPDSVLVTAQACTRPASPCLPTTDKGTAEATATLKAVLTLKPLIRVIPGAAVTAGGDVNLKGTSRLQNSDRTTNGVLVDAGGLTAVDVQVELKSLAGTPVATAIIENDASLSTASNSGGVFNTFFGMSPSRFAASPAVRRIRADSPSARATALLADYAQGYSAFHVDGPLQFDGPMVGSVARPILLVSTDSVGCRSECQFIGLIYSDTSVRSGVFDAPMQTQGALVTRGEHRQSSGETVVYDLAVLKTLRQQTQSFVRVPGSWYDL